jgi:hypothetical protein
MGSLGSAHCPYAPNKGLAGGAGGYPYPFITPSIRLTIYMG